MKKLNLYVVPHTHIDVQWYYTYETFRTTLAKRIFRDHLLPLMRKDPGYCFSQDQVPVFTAAEACLDADERAFFRECIRDGRLEIVGGTYVQPEIAEPSGESFIKQIFYGQRWFEAHYQKRAQILWNIDTFGQCRQIAQIAAKCGYKGFVFYRDIPPALFDKMPLDFLYESPDGTRLPAHWFAAGYSVVPHFNGTPAGIPHELKILCAHAPEAPAFTLIPWGGDLYNPNATTSQMEEYLRNLFAEIGYTVGEVRFGTPSAFFAEHFSPVQIMREDLNPPLMGFDLRGLYTARVELKLLSRRCEAALEACEALYARVRPSGSALRGALDRMWQTLLYYHFHDVIGGSCIDPVHEDACRTLHTLLKEADDFLAAFPGTGEGYALFNPSAAARREAVSVTLEHDGQDVAFVTPDGAAFPSETVRVQSLPNGRRRFDCLLLSGPAEPFSLQRVTAVSASAAPPRPLGRSWIENECFRVEADGSGAIRSILDKRAGREVLSAPIDLLYDEEGAPDMEGALDFTGVTHSLLAAPGAAVCEAFETPVRQYLTLTKPFMGADVTLTLSLFRSVPRVDFELNISDYQGGNHYARVRFPLRADGVFYTETPFHCTRRTEGEIWPAQTWGGFSGGEYGAAVLNRGTAAYRAQGGALDMALMRSYANYTQYRGDGLWRDYPEFLNGKTNTELARERGAHTFHFALAAGEDMTPQDFSRMGHSYNHPVRLLPHMPACKAPLFSQANKDVCVTSVQYFPEENCVGVRFYNTADAPRTAEFPFSPDAMRISRTNLLYEGGEAAGAPDGALSIPLGPCEIAALCISL